MKKKVEYTNLERVLWIAVICQWIIICVLVLLLTS